MKRHRHSEQNYDGATEVENILYNVTYLQNNESTPASSKGTLNQTDEGIVDNELYGMNLGDPSGDGKPRGIGNQEGWAHQDHLYVNRDSLHANQDPVYTNTAAGLDSGFVHNDIYDSKLTDL
ncbi:uncharacterized protein LOC118419037 [Branchiostoma floridae]|nr:uncharacterized protein LOC118419037 [Branchiostoma floridae]